MKAYTPFKLLPETYGNLKKRALFSMAVDHSTEMKNQILS